MTRHAWFQCNAGTAGDMTLGALVDAGADPIEIAAILGGLGVDGWAFTVEPTQRCGVRASRALVAVDGGHEGPAEPVDHHDHDHDRHDHDHHDHDHHDHDHHDHDQAHGHTHRPFREIRAILAAADLPERVRSRSLAVFTALAEAEGALHGMAADDVELHEVGSLDAIIDIVGSCAALEVLGIDSVSCSAIGVGHGTVRAAHGTISNPAPATLSLLAAAGAPVRGLDDRHELATPTGVALMTVLATSFGPPPAMTVRSVGHGAGGLDIPGRPNVVQVVIGEIVEAVTAPDAGREARLLEANVDDMTGEVLAHTVATLLAAGAHDAWVTPIVMKKGRPAHTVHALCDPSLTEQVAAVLVAETGTLGLRATTVARWPQQRSEVTVDVEGHPVRVKVSAERCKVEHDDAQIAAAALGMPLRQVLSLAESLAAQLA